MADWTVISSLATGGGTLVLAIATFVSVRSANRAARVAEQGLMLSRRPLLMPSRQGDPQIKAMWGDEHWARINGGQGTVELVDQRLYFAISLRNVGNGVAVLQGWRSTFGIEPNAPAPKPGDFRPQTRDLYVPSGDVAFWQAAIREPEDPDYARLRTAIERREIIAIELLYSDHEGAQRAVARFYLAPGNDEQWICSVVRHWDLDRTGPR